MALPEWSCTSSHSNTASHSLSAIQNSTQACESAMSGQDTRGGRRSRGNNSRLICLGCRQRRIRCELPENIDICLTLNDPQQVSTPCYRCKRNGIPCMVRRTTLGRPSQGKPVASNSRHGENDNMALRVLVELPGRGKRGSPSTASQNRGRQVRHSPVMISDLLSSENVQQDEERIYRWQSNTLLVHKPQSTDTVLIIRAVDTLKSEDADRAWFRHLPSRVGRVPALDLSIKAIVAACAFARGAPRLTSEHCHAALAHALVAVQKSTEQSHCRLSDDTLASIALLSPFEGIVDIPMRSQIEGLATIFTSRPTTFEITELARDVFDFHACDSFVMACIDGTCSALENVDSAYYHSRATEYPCSEHARLRALGLELFVRLPRLVGHIRSLRSRTRTDTLLLDDLELAQRLLRLQDLQRKDRPSRKLGTAVAFLTAQSFSKVDLHFDRVEEFESMLYYWLNRILTLRLLLHLRNMCLPAPTYDESTDTLTPFHASFDDATVRHELCQLVSNVLMSVEYASGFRLRKRKRLLAYAIVILWGTLIELPSVFECVQSMYDNDRLRDWLLLKMSAALVVKPAFTEEDMDEAAEIFVGGPVRGKLAELYGLL